MHKLLARDVRMDPVSSVQCLVSLVCLFVCLFVSGWGLFANWLESSQHPHPSQNSQHAESIVWLYSNFCCLKQTCRCARRTLDSWQVGHNFKSLSTNKICPNKYAQFIPSNTQTTIHANTQKKHKKQEIVSHKFPFVGQQTATEMNILIGPSPEVMWFVGNCHGICHIWYDIPTHCPKNTSNFTLQHKFSTQDQTSTVYCHWVNPSSMGVHSPPCFHVRNWQIQWQTSFAIWSLN